MKAVVLVAGYATRLHPLTKTKAKGLLPLGGKPIMQYIFDQIEKIAEQSNFSIFEISPSIRY